jgi:NAD(P)-dependent dehydrogenase (short-subunit alcohol dehydrogenase family)
MIKLLEQKVAVVTGGTTGIGLAIAQQYASAGARVIVTGTNRESLDEVAAEHDQIIGHVADAGDVDEMDMFLRTVRDHHGSLDILVLNAVHDAHAPLGRITEEQFDSMMRVNLRGPLFSIQSAAPLMRPGGSIILIGSTASVSPPAGMAIYGAVKAGLRGMMRSLIQDLKGTGIRLNLLSPGAVNTESLKRALVKAAGEEKADSIIASIGDRSPAGRIGDPAEVARAALFLASDMASYVNGAELFADGGLTNV